MPHRQLLASLILALVAGHALAQDVRLYGGSEAVDPQEVARILDHSKRSEPLIKMRSLRLLGNGPATQIARAESDALGTELGGTPATGSRPSSLALPVQFAFDSADILPTAKPQLDALAAGIRLLPAGQTVVIEGHTDAAGSAQYNEQLALRRAFSVKRYLVASQGIVAERLSAVGIGEAATLPGHDPYAPENRRVQFRGE